MIALLELIFIKTLFHHPYDINTLMYWYDTGQKLKSKVNRGMNAYENHV